MEGFRAIFWTPLLLLAVITIIHSHAQVCYNNAEIIHVTRLETVSRECYCNVSSTTCSWSTFEDPENILSSGITESLLEWQSNTGYGQYICTEDNLIVVTDVLILPESKPGKQCISYTYLYGLGRAWLHIRLVISMHSA